MAYSAEVHLCTLFNEAAKAYELDPLRDINAKIELVTTLSPGGPSIDSDSVGISISALKHPNQLEQTKTNDKVTQFIGDLLGRLGMICPNEWTTFGKNAAGLPTMVCTNVASVCTVPDSAKIALASALETMTQKKLQGQPKNWAVGAKKT